MIRNEFYPLMLSHHYFWRLRSLLFIPWAIRVNNKTPLKGLRSLPKVQTNFPIDDSLVFIVLVMLNNEFSPDMFSNHSFGRLKIFWNIK